MSGTKRPPMPATLVPCTNWVGCTGTGRGVAQDYAKAREWYQKAADAGNATANDVLSRFFA
jgi:hypothetical protein